MKNVIIKKMQNVQLVHCIACVMLVLHFLLILPLYQISRYDIPSADDYSTAVTNLQYASLSEGFFPWIRGCFERTIEAYNGWQGTFSTYFFCASLNPAGQYENYYFLVPVTLLSLFHLSMFWMLYVALYKVLNIRRSIVIMVYVIVSTLCVQMMPSVSEGFYWASGAIMYTGFFSIAMLAIAEQLLIFRLKKSWRLPLRIMGLALLTFIIGGGNYPTAIAMLIVLAYAAGYCSLYNRRALLRVALPLMTCAIGLILSFVAPGNTARMETENVAYQGTISSTLHIGFMLGFQWIRQWCTMPLLVALFMLVPITGYGMRHITHRFPLPLLWCILSLAGYCAILMPSAYSYGWIGPDRYMNIVYFGFVLMICSDVFYIIGWFMNKFHQNCSNFGLEYKDICKSMFFPIKKNIVFIAIWFAIIIKILLSQNFYFDSKIPSVRERYVSEQAYIDLREGRAWNYYQQYLNRMDVLLNNEVSDAVFKPYEDVPITLYFDDITEDPWDWRNQSMSSYFEKASVTLMSE